MDKEDFYILEVILGIQKRWVFLEVAKSVGIATSGSKVLD